MERGLFTVYRKVLDGSDAVTEQAIRLCDNHVEIRRGRAEEATSLAQIPRKECLGNCPWREMKWRRTAWVAEGYRLVGYGTYENDRVQMVHETDPVPPEAQPRDERLSLHWGTNALLTAQPLEDALFDIAKALRSEDVSASVQSRYVEGWTGLTVETDNRAWALKLQPTGELTEVGQQEMGARLLVADGTVPLLVLMRIEDLFPGSIEFVWLEQSDAWLVEPAVARDDPHLGDAVAPFEKTLRVAAALDLLLARAELLGEGTKGDPEPTWF